MPSCPPSPSGSGKHPRPPYTTRTSLVYTGHEHHYGTWDCPRWTVAPVCSLPTGPLVPKAPRGTLVYILGTGRDAVGTRTLWRGTGRKGVKEGFKSLERDNTGVPRKSGTGDPDRGTEDGKV